MPAVNSDATATPIAMNDGVLRGGGEMGALMRSRDWSVTPVGPVGSWPQSLKTALGILLDSGFPMYVAWGPEFTQFYNDAYRPILGATKHPAALGAGTPETFREIWDFIGPMFRRVLSDGEATTLVDQLLPLDRNGFVEECYFTFSYSAIRNEASGVGGVLVTVSETTQRVYAERGLRTLRELGQRAVATAQSAETACVTALETLGKDQPDVPFAMLYLLKAGNPRAVLAAKVNVDSAALDFPAALQAAVAGAKRGVLIRDLSALVADLPASGWPEPIRCAVALPVAGSSQDDPPAGFLVTGINPRRALDESYWSFFDLATQQIAAALASARAYEEQRARAAALAELDRSKTTFFSNVSHEFRTPLTLLLGPIEDVLMLHPELSPEVRDGLEIAHRNALRLQRLVNSLLDFSRVQARRAEASYEPTDLAAFTADIASSFRSAMDKAGLRYEVSCAPSQRTVLVDRDMWEKVVLNLISNAFKYTHQGCVSVTVEEQAESLVLRVSDTGIGIDAANIPRLFERFHRVEGARGRTLEGTGIGLALVHELVSLHQGTISVESEPGKGSTFQVSIPARYAPARVNPSGAARLTPLQRASFVEEALRWLPANGSVAPSAEPSGNASNTYAEATVLVADDNSDMRDYLVRLLSPHYRVILAASGGEALEAALTSRPDLVLADVMMPQLDGFQLLRALRSAPGASTIPVILLSARAGEEARSEGIEAGADDYLVKPFSARELLARVGGNLKLARVRRGAAEALQKSEERLAQIFAEAPVGICVLRGRDLIYEMANPRYAEFLPGRQIVGRPIRDVIPEISPELLRILHSGLDTGEPITATDHLVPLDRNHDGVLEDYWFTFVYQPLREPDGTVGSIVVVAVDVSAQVRARRGLELTNRALEEFAYVSSHDIQEPLRSININTQLLERELKPHFTPKALVYARQVTSGVKQLNQLMKDLLEYSRNLQMEEAPHPLADLNRSLARALDTLRSRIEEESTTIDAGTLPQVTGDEVQFAQVFQNLISNAIKYRKPEDNPCVEIRSRTDGSRHVISVADNGIGFDPRYADRIFGLFKRLHTDEYPGTGIGLAICKRIVERYGGRIWAESQPNQGSVFYIELPGATE